MGGKQACRAAYLKKGRAGFSTGGTTSDITGGPLYAATLRGEGLGMLAALGDSGGGAVRGGGCRSICSWGAAAAAASFFFSRRTSFSRCSAWAWSNLELSGKYSALTRKGVERTSCSPSPLAP